jgi:methyl-accepting chemotaxis protein
MMTLAFLLVTITIVAFGSRALGDPGAGAEHAANLSLIIRTNAAFIILVTLFMGSYTLLLSHRMAGPSYRVNNSVLRALDGDPDFQIHLRDKDYLHEVAGNLNRLLQRLVDLEATRGDEARSGEALRSQFEDLRLQAGRLTDRIRAEPGGAEEIRTLAEALDQAIDEQRSRIDLPGRPL